MVDHLVWLYVANLPNQGRRHTANFTQDRYPTVIVILLKLENKPCKNVSALS
jgi:hypothetical protein